MPRQLPRLNKRLFEHDFQRLAALSAASVTGFGLLLILVILYAGSSSNNASLEQERTLLVNALNRAIARTLSEQKSVAWWDDSVLKITPENVDLTFTDSNFGIFLTETYGHDEVAIVGPEDQPLYYFAGGERRDPQAFEERRAALEPVIAESRGRKGAPLAERPDVFGIDQKYDKLGGAFHNSRWAGHIMAVDGRLAVVTAMTIVPNVDMNLLKPVHALLISIVFIDADFVSNISRSQLLSGLTLTSEPSKLVGVENLPLQADDGSYTGYLSWYPSKPGRVLLTMVLPLVTIGVIAVALLANGMLRRLHKTSLDLAQSERDARHAATHDMLSGLPNRSHFAEVLAHELDSAQKINGHVVVAFIDLDCFKDVNDTLGHHAGDELIRAVAQRLKERMRPTDLLFRYGGDEFAVLWSASGPQACSILASRIVSAFSDPFVIASQGLRVTASVGIAMAPEHGANADELTRHADIALYQSKSLGRDRSTVFTREMARQVEERRAIETDLKSALGRNELRLAYQPIMCAKTGTIAGIEALLRWRHPTRGELSPAIFVPIAEHAGLMPALGDWVIARAMKDARQWPDLKVSINLSAMQFRQSDIVERLRYLSDELGADPSQFVLEITESVLMDTSEHTRQALDAIFDMGFMTALDDFGTGYSSLSYLCNFKFNKIKIDRSFVSGMARSENVRKIVQAVIAIGNGLEMDIVAEGVETMADAQTMAELGCNELQGYFFSRPVDVDKLLEFIALHRTPAGPASNVHVLERGAISAIG